MSTELDFQPWPKTARLNRDMFVTEKIDGTNAAVRVIDAALVDTGSSRIKPGFQFGQHIRVDDSNGRELFVGAQSRKKLISPGKQSDNAGFAQFVFENAQLFADLLGEGIHFGEWYGPAIQKNLHQIEEKRFMLFNTARWGAPETRELLRGRFNGQVEVATLLYQGPFDVAKVNEIVADLREQGSKHCPGVQYVEGVIVYQEAAGINFKVTLENDHTYKGNVA